MLAVIKAGSRQHLVKKGDIIEIDKVLQKEKIEFAHIIVYDTDSKQEFTSNSISVTGEIIAQKRARKIIVFKKKRRNNYRKKQGHRQYITVVRITNIALN